MDKLKRLKQLSVGLNTNFRNVSRFATGYPSIPRFETGSLQLDFALGGGLPVGRMSLFYGEKSSGKTTTAMRIAGLQQKLCANCRRPVSDIFIDKIYDEDTEELIDVEITGTCDCVKTGLYEVIKHPNEKIDDFRARKKVLAENSFEPFVVAFIDQEGSFDPVWARKVGLDPDLILLVEPETAEECIDIHETLIKSGIVDFIILDSIAAMTPSTEITESTEKWQQGLQARLLNKAFRKYISAVQATKREYNKYVTQIFINQLREKIGMMFGDNTTLPAGKGQRFSASIELKLWASQYEKDSAGSELIKDFIMQVGHSVKTNFKTEKNKTYTAQITGSYRMNLDTGTIEDDKLILQMCEKYGLIEKDGNKWKLGDNLSFNTKKEMEEHLIKPSIKKQISRHLLEKLLKKEI